MRYQSLSFNEALTYMKNKLKQVRFHFNLGWIRPKILTSSSIIWETSQNQ